MRCHLIWVRGEDELPVDRHLLTAAESDWLEQQTNLFCMVRIIVAYQTPTKVAKLDSRDITRWLKLYSTGWDIMPCGNLRFIGFASADEAMAFRMRWC